MIKKTLYIANDGTEFETKRSDDMSNEVGCEDKELFQLSNGRYIMSE